MKRFLLLLMLFSFFTLVGCTFTTASTTTLSSTTSTSTTTSITSTSITMDTSTQFNSLKQLMLAFQSQNNNGYDYEAIQTLGDLRLNETFMTQRIDRSGNIKIYTEVTEHQLLAFNPNQQRQTLEQVYYFHNNQIGVQRGEGALNWRAGTLAEYDCLPIKITTFDQSAFVDITFTEEGNTQVFQAKINPTQLPTTFGVVNNEIRFTLVEIRYSLQTNQLQEISIKLGYEVSAITILFTPYWQAATVVLP